MKKTIQRIMAFALCLLLSVALLPIPARADGVDVDEAHFPDENFRNYLIEEIDSNGSFSDYELSNVRWLEPTYRGIKTLKGIEYFTELENLVCDKNLLTALDVSHNSKLTLLYCLENQIKTLDVSKNPELTVLICDENPITAMDVSHNTKLTFLSCQGTQFSSLNLSKNIKLTDLHLGGNPLGTLDVSKNTELKSFSCSDTNLTTLDVTNNTTLEDLYCNYNQLTTLDVSKNPELKRLDCGGNNIQSLDIQNNPYLIEAYRTGTQEAFDGLRLYRIEDANGHIVQELVVDIGTEIIDGGVSAPVITTQPVKKTVASGKSVTFKVAATGEGLKYQWYVLKPGADDWAKLSGETSAKLSFTVKKSQNGYKYRCAVSNDESTIYSKSAALTVVSMPKVTTQPKPATVKAGKKITFKVKATGGELKYQWYRLKPGTKKWMKISKATKATYTFKAAKKWNGYKYKCLVKNAAGKKYSKAVKLTVK